VPTVLPPPPASRADFARTLGLKRDRVGAAALYVDESLDEAGRADVAARQPVPVRPLTDLAPDDGGEVWAPVRAPLALLQFTSGSVLSPRPVSISHENLAANCRGIRLAGEDGPEDVWAGWLPLFHDMGVIGLVSVPLFAGGRIVLADPSTFLRDPLSWLRLISEHRGTITTAPGFAYAMCAARAHLATADLDLSSLRRASIGSEPVVRADLERFVERFRPFGLSRGALRPAYGLAEATVAVSLAPARPTYRWVSADRSCLESARSYVPAPEGEGLELVSVGPPIEGLELRIVDPETGAGLAERRVGEVELAGTSISAGYAGEPPREGAWLKTGDLGFLLDGELYVTGRLKELIKVAGRSVLPMDLELTVAELPGVRPGGVSAFEIERDGHGAAGLAVETSLGGAEAAAFAALVRRRIYEVLGLALAGLWLVPPRTLPKTTSGKRQRRLTAERAGSGALGAPL